MRNIRSSPTGRRPFPALGYAAKSRPSGRPRDDVLHLPPTVPHAASSCRNAQSQLRQNSTDACKHPPQTNKRLRNAVVALQGDLFRDALADLEAEEFNDQSWPLDTRPADPA